MSPEDMGKL
jgi:vacuolar protein sorting-associated protein 13A/C